MSSASPRHWLPRARFLRWVGVLVSVCAVLSCGRQASPSGKPIVIAADGRVEQQILAELTAQLLRDRGYPVERRTGLQAEWMTRKALEAGSVGLVWQETGRVWHVYLNHDQPITNEAELYRRVRQEDRLNEIAWLSPFPWSARLSIIVANDTAAAHRLATIADLAQHISRADPDLALCAPEEWYESTWGIRGLERVYQFRFKPGLVRMMPHEEAYQGLLDGSCAVALGYGKDLSPYSGKLVALRDDRAFFPVSSLAPTVHVSVLAEYPELERILAELTSALDAKNLVAMEQQVAVGQARTERVALRFLRDAQLVGKR